MRLIIALIIAWTATPLVLELIHRKGFKIRNTPAWVITVVACLAVAIIVNVITGAVRWSPFEIFALTAIVYFGANSFFTLIIKRWFPTRGASNVNQT